MKPTGIHRLTALAASVLVAGCASAPHLHDATKAAASAGAKTTYADAKVLEVIEVEEANLQDFLTEELLVVAENRRLRSELTLMRMAADDHTPVAKLLADAHARMRDIGVPSVAGARAFARARAGGAVIDEELREQATAIVELGGPRPPECRLDRPLPARLELPEGADAELIDIDYEQYRELCAQALEKARAVPRVGGELAAANTALEAALHRVAEVRVEIRDGKVEAGKVAAEIEAAKNAAKPKGAVAEAEEGLTRGLDALDSGFQALAAAGVEVKEMQNVRDLILLLGAVAGSADEKALAEAVKADPELGEAVKRLKAIRSLAADLEALIQQQGAPPVAHLVAELRHQTIKIEDAKRRLALAEEGVALRRAARAALTRELRFLKDYHDHLCNFAFLQAGSDDWPGAGCDDFEVDVRSVDGRRRPDVTCRHPRETFTPCPLEKTWKAQLAARDLEDGAERELYAAIASLAQADLARGDFIATDYRMVHLDHRKAVQANRFAVRAWDNLVSVSVDQLAAYHAAGIKPAELADLIVKAAGFAAVTGGIVAR